MTLSRERRAKRGPGSLSENRGLLKWNIGIVPRFSASQLKHELSERKADVLSRGKLPHICSRVPFDFNL